MTSVSYSLFVTSLKKNKNELHCFSYSFTQPSWDLSGNTLSRILASYHLNNIFQLNEEEKERSREGEREKEEDEKEELSSINVTILDYNFTLGKCVKKKKKTSMSIAL